MTDLAPTADTPTADIPPSQAGGMSRASIDATLALALTQHQRGQAALADALYDQVLLLDPANADALHLKGVLALAQGSSATALDLIERACGRLPGSALFQRSRAEALSALGRWAESVTALETALALKPDWAEAHAAMGVAHAASGNRAAAKASLVRATALDPQLVEAWSNLGVLHLADKETAWAVTAFESALKASPGFVDALNGLGVALTEIGRFDDALAAFDRMLTDTPSDSPRRADALTNRGVALQALGRWEAALADSKSAAMLAPDRAAIWRNMAKSLTALARLEEAEAACTRALASAPHDAAARYERAFVRLLAGDLANGFDDYRSRPTVDRARYPSPMAPLPSDLSGRKFRLVIEQGLGEHLFFLRYAASLAGRGATLAIETDDKLARVLAGHPELRNLITRDRPTPDFEPLLIGDLPFLTGGAHAPHPLALTPDATLRPAIAERLAALGPAPYVALTWRAGIQDGKSLSKTIPLASLADALAGSRGTLISLQRDPLAHETDTLAERIGRKVHDLSSLNGDLAQILAALAAIDEYVGVSNTNMHLRAGLGLPARVLVPHPPEFRWCATGDRSPWFPNFRIYRATLSGWDDAMARLKDDLATSRR